MNRILVTILILTLAVLCSTTSHAGQLSDYVLMQIVAHEDDDILFMNPDVRNMVAAGYGNVTVYLTAGESVGSDDGTQSREVFAANRQKGIRAAYAAMAGVANSWTRATLALNSGNLVELDTLASAPQVRVIFMNLPDGGDTLPGNTNALLCLYEKLQPSANTLVPTGGPITRSYSYTRATLVSGLVNILTAFHPYVVRLLDPQPYWHGSWDGTGQPPLDFVSDDNPDHKYSARFANEALAKYSGPGGKKHVSVLYYKGYSIAQHLGNLGPVEYTEKRGIVDAYKQWDINFQQYENNYLGFFGATYNRYPSNTTWMKRQKNGRLMAFGVENNEVVMWAETAVGGAWKGPVALGGGPVAPHLAIGVRPDGRLQLFALRIPHEQDHDPGYAPPGAPIQEIVTAIQTSPGALTFGSWQSLGNPDTAAWPHFDLWTGVPAVAANADGRLQVFVKNNNGGVSTKWELVGGGWSNWLDFGGGPDIQDGLAAITSVGGHIELFATTRLGYIAHWAQVAPNSGFIFDSTFPRPNVQITNAVSSPTVTYNQDGRLEVFYREQGTARVWTAFQTAVDGPWSTSLVNLYGDAGIGPVAAMRHDSSGIIMLFERNAFGGVSMTGQIGPNTYFGLQWVDLGGLIPNFPSAAVDGAGRTVVATVGIDGQLYLRRQLSANPADAFGSWTPVGQ
jgi:LmbE family N-acetylglucosaminyl deacetylase